MSISPKALQALKYIFDAGGKATKHSMHEDMGPLAKTLHGELFPRYVGVNGHSETLYLTSEGRAELDIHPKTPKLSAEDHMICSYQRRARKASGSGAVTKFAAQSGRAGPIHAGGLSPVIDKTRCGWNCCLSSLARTGTILASSELCATKGIQH